ncbi:MAG: type III-B CRISPR module-associated protein Cmr5 [Candidatus Methylomirabilis sp.]|nr:type III-B CRISPR module-associated protein Cmr5 [Candidatus Methylomirabilis sp.]
MPKLAKGAPALIMQSGLMPVLAFYKDKGKSHHEALLHHLCEWLCVTYSGRIANAPSSRV